MAGFNLRPLGLIAMYDFLAEFVKKGFDFSNEFAKKYENHPMGGSNINFGAFDLSGLPKVVEWERRYLPPEKLGKYEGSIGLYDPRVRGGGQKKPRKR